jgi:hemolysin III
VALARGAPVDAPPGSLDVFVVIAGTYTPFALIALRGALAGALLIAVWVGAAAGIVLTLAWIDAPEWLIAPLYVLLGWVGAIALPSLIATLGAGPAALVAAGGVLYTAGAVIYARKRPDPVSAVFGFHEVFHVLVIAAAAAVRGDRVHRAARRARVTGRARWAC